MPTPLASRTSLPACGERVGSLPPPAGGLPQTVALLAAAGGPAAAWAQGAADDPAWPAWAAAGLGLLALILALLVLLVWLVWSQQRAAAPRQRPAPGGQTPAAVPQPQEPEEAAQESFAYTVSHDLRAPIRVVEGFTKILKEDYGPQLDRIGNDHLERILGAATRMNHMIDALLALAQLSSQPLGNQRVDLSQLAHYVAEDLRRQHPGHPVALHIEAGLDAQGDPTLLRVVLENLLGNAWKYTGKCGHPEIWLERHPTEPATFTVRDNGAGFDMRFADRLFGVFQRLHSASDFAGTGVGLASVRRIVRRHGGEVWAESEVDKGARFHFSLSMQPPGPHRH